MPINPTPDAVPEGQAMVTAKDYLTAIQRVLVKYNNIESDIPVEDPYWDYLNKYRALTK